jgi:hypothetical protein
MMKLEKEKLQNTYLLHFRIKLLHPLKEVIRKAKVKEVNSLADLKAKGTLRSNA